MHSSPQQKTYCEIWWEYIFSPSSKYVTVHWNNTNPWLYRVVFSQEKGLRDDDIVKSSGRLIKQKVCECNEEAIEWPATRTIN